MHLLILVYRRVEFSSRRTRVVHKEGGGGQGARPPERGLPPTGPQMTFLVNVIENLE